MLSIQAIPETTDCTCNECHRRGRYWTVTGEAQPIPKCPLHAQAWLESIRTEIVARHNGRAVVH